MTEICFFLGPVELASAGVSISIVNIVSKLFNIPLLSVATSFVSEDLSRSVKASAHKTHHDSAHERKQLSSVSTALLLAVGIGIFEALVLFLGSGLFIDLMGIPHSSPMHAPAQRFLSLKALGAPAVVVTLALQGVLRGFKDTRTPVFCLGIGSLAAMFLLPVLVHYFQLGLTGAAISTATSQYIVAFLMIWHVNKRAVLLPPKLANLQFGVYLKSGGFLLGRTLAVLMTMTIGTSMAARQGPSAMAAHQICLQIWLAVSLLTDALATSGQALIADSLSKGEYKTVKEICYFVLKIGVLTGASLAVILGLCYGSLLGLFTKDMEVLQVARTGILFVSACQPINALAYIFDGLHYGVSDFRYAALSMMVAGAISSAVLLYAPGVIGLRGVWLGLTLLMSLRTVAGFSRLLSKGGPWWFLHRDSPSLEMGSHLAT
ncbi:Protein DETOXIFICATION 45, chloroplastic [Dionaea muscipula]